MLSSLAVIRKPSSGEDFAPAVLFGAEPPEPVLAEAGAWLQTHINVQGTQMVVVRRTGGEWWVFRASVEQATDSAGRLLHQIVAGRLAVAGLTWDRALRLLIGSFRSRQPTALSGPTSELPMDAPITAISGSDELALQLQVLVTSEGVASFIRPENAAAALASLPDRELSFVAASNGATAPAHWPAVGGIVLSPVSMLVPRDIAILADGLKTAPHRPDLAALSALCPSRPRRRELLRLVLGLSSDLPDPGAAEVAWLLGQPAGRNAALAVMNRDQIGASLRNGDLDAGDLDALSDRFHPEHAPDVARLLKNRPGGLTRFIAWFGPSAEGILGLLPPAAAALLQALTGDGTPPPEGATAEDGALLVRTGLVQRAAASAPADVVRRIGAAAAALAHSAGPVLTPILGALGFTDPAPVLALAAGWAPPVGCDAGRAEAAAGRLAALGLLPLTAAVAAVARGWPLGVLRAAGVEDWTLALLDPARRPPARPPGPPAAPLVPLLAASARRAEFWWAWTGGLTPDWWGWLQELLRDQPDQDIFARLGAVRGGRRLSGSDLRPIVGLLSEAELCRQVVAWSAAHEGGRAEALAVLLGAPALQGELARWLEANVGGLGPLPPFPAGLSAELLTVLLPLLDPIRDVLRPVMARPFRTIGEEALLDALFDRLAGTGGVPPPAPGRDAALRRPDWIETLARLPGWRHWLPHSPAQHDEAAQ